MPAWLIAALALLADPAAGAIEKFTGLDIPFIGPPIPPGLRRNGAQRRRRRRRALTASDRADISYIAATISKPAADRFAQQLIAGLTR